MDIIIAVIKNLRNRTIGYKVLNTETKECKHLSCETIIANRGICNPVNFSEVIGQLEENYNDEDRYPVIDTKHNFIKNNRIVIIKHNSNGTYMATDYTGRIREATDNQVHSCDESKIANLGFLKSIRKSEDKKETNLTKYGDKPELSILDIRKKIANAISSVIQLSQEDITSRFNGKTCFTELRQLDELSNIEVIKNENVVDSVKPFIDESEEIDSKSSTKEAEVTPVEYIDTGEYKLKIENDKDRTIVINIEPNSYSGMVTVPEGVTHIYKNAFDGSNASYIKLPSTLVYIGESAFSNTSITEIELPKSVTAIPHYCFYKSSLRKINLEHIVSIGNFSFSESHIIEAKFVAPIIQFGVSAFEKCKQLELIEHPTTVKKIRSNCFCACRKLKAFDFTGVTDIEDMAFYDTGLENVVIIEDVTFIKNGTFVGNELVSIEIKDGTYKLADGCIKNTGKKSITFTLPKSISNVGNNVLHDYDTVRCYKNSVAETAATLAGSKIEYLDEFDNKPSLFIAKANMMGVDVSKLLADTITAAYSKEDATYEYEIDESKLINIQLNNDLLVYLKLKDTQTPVDYKEKPKFKCILEHLSKTGDINGVGLSSNMVKLSSTFDITQREIYNDGVSRLYEFKFSDHKFESITGKYLVAITGNVVRWCGLNNKYTDIICRRTESKDLNKIIKAISVGDAIGYDCIINGTKYDHIAGKSDKPINDKTLEKLTVNIYQALFECCLSVKLDRNHIALILPVNDTIIKCASLGKSVWANEAEESYKVKQCVIEDIQPIKNNTIFEYGVSTPNRDDGIFNKLSKLSNSQVNDRIDNYSKLLKATKSPYTQFKNYCKHNNIEKVEELDLPALGMLLSFPIIEDRSSEWLAKYIGKTIVNAAKSRYILKDKTVINQYKTVKRVAMKNKLIIGGDRTIYIYEVINKFGAQMYVKASTLDLDDLFKTGKSMEISKNPLEHKIFVNPDSFDVVNENLFIKIVPAFIGGKQESEYDKIPIWLTVYKPNGLYYISYISNKHRKVVPLIQVGEFDVLLDYISCSNTSVASGYDALFSAGSTELNNSNNYRRAYAPRSVAKSYIGLLEARKLVIYGDNEVQHYLDLGINPVLCHMMGIQQQTDTLYTDEGFEMAKQVMLSPKTTDTEDIDIDLSDINELVQSDNIKELTSKEIDETDIEIDIDEEDLEGFEDGISEEDMTLEDALRINELIKKGQI